MTTKTAAEIFDPVEIKAPPSKSLSHRYLIGAALAKGESVVRNTLESSDLEATRGILCDAGAAMKPLEHNGQIDGWHVRGMMAGPKGGEEKPVQCDVCESGTTCRLLSAVLAAGHGLFHIFGRGRMHERPIGGLCDILRALGCGIHYEGVEGRPPFLLDAHGLKPALVDGHVRVGMDESSQYFSGLLLAAPLAASPLTLEVGGSKAVSWPYVGLTLQCLWDFGIRFRVERRPRLGEPWIDAPKSVWKDMRGARPGCARVRVWPSEYLPGEYEVEGDWSGASYFLAAGALGKKPVKVLGLNPHSAQGDRQILEILQKMGARVEIGENCVTVFPSTLHGVSLDMGSCPDLVPTVAVLAAFAQGSTRIANVAHLRLKESDRIAAPALELGKIGVTVDALSDGLLISGVCGAPRQSRGKPVSPAPTENICLCAHNDHRMAMSLALLDLRDDSLDVAKRLDDPDVVRKSFPTFWDLWRLVR